MDPEPEPEAEATPEEIVLAEETPPEAEPEPEPDLAPELVSEEGSLEFDAAATDVSEIFISPSDAEHDTASGNYEAVVLQIDPPLAPPPIADAGDDPSHTDTVAADDWSLLDDDEPPADAESVIEESPLTYGGSAETPAPNPADPAWVEQMFAEAEAQALAKITRTPPHPAAAATAASEETTGNDAAAASAAAPAVAKPPPTQPSEAALAQLHRPETPRPPWQYVAGVVGLALLFALQIAHFNRQSIAINPTFGPLASKVYGLFGVTLTPRWDLTAYSVRQLGADADDAEGTRLRVRVSLHNESARVQPFPLLRLTLLDRFNNPVGTRDIEPAEYLPKRLADQRLIEPDQRIDAEVHVMDPTKAAMGFVIDACLRASNGNIGCTADARAQQPQKRADG
jgi:hypothetical protein